MGALHLTSVSGVAHPTFQVWHGGAVMARGKRVFYATAMRLDVGVVWCGQRGKPVALSRLGLECVCVFPSLREAEACWRRSSLWRRCGAGSVIDPRCVGGSGVGGVAG